MELNFSTESDLVSRSGADASLEESPQARNFHQSMVSLMAIDSSPVWR
jgi:hypothetical protein